MKHFTIDELCRSNVAIERKITNKPDMNAVGKLEDLINYVLDPAREKLGAPIMVTSGYRCRRLNDAVGGNINSQHLKGEAADIISGDNARLFAIIRDSLAFDQLIDEKNLSWIHVSFKVGNNRNQVIKIE